MVHNPDSLQPQSSALYAASLVPSSSHDSWLLELVNTPVNFAFVDSIAERVLEFCCHALGSDVLDRDPDFKLAFMGFIIDVVRSCRLSTGTVLVALVYLDRAQGRFSLLQYGDFPAERVFFASTLLASKYVNDANMTNRDWACNTPFDVKDVLKMERDFLAAVGYDLSVRDQDLEPMYAALCSQSPLALPALYHHAIARYASSHASPLVQTLSHSSPVTSSPACTSYSSPSLWPFDSPTLEVVYCGSPFGRAGAIAPEPLTPEWSFCDFDTDSRPSTGSSQSDASLLTPPDCYGLDAEVAGFAYSSRTPDSDESFEAGVLEDAIELQPLGHSTSSADVFPPTLCLPSPPRGCGTQSNARDDPFCSIPCQPEAKHTRRRSQGLVNVTNIFCGARDEVVEMDITSGAATSWADLQWSWMLDNQAAGARPVKRKDRKRHKETPPPYRRQRVAHSIY
ncbi:hypothetical protein EXIGLDRAFT_765595 [Exidia glandulosa HHB12029]|uniref:Cyclin-like domain-containing protein n=1 Tax=Exidia glandulosa HHB12029 TaxID=1314781 RepID=A0A165KEP9_EXIGL|nr:hypothetical protein EXIGLDRAFT_765595 [Exidia glandulosa HHB12029]